MEESCIIGIDIGGTNFRIGAVDSKSRVSHFRKIRVGEVFHTQDALGDLAAYLTDYCELLFRQHQHVKVISMGFPATLDKARKVVLQAPNVAFMENLPVVEAISHRLGIPVVIERDVCMALFYDQAKYGLGDCEVLAGCYFGTGIGNAICVNGKLLLGKDGTAGELGHIPVDGSQEICGCGNEGCMENLAGGKYLARLCREVYPRTKVEDLFTEHGDEPLLRQFVDRMAMTVATEVNILNPNYMLIGGGVPNMKDFPREYLEERIRFRTRKPYPEKNLNLIFTEDEEEKCVIGAAVYAHRSFGIPD